MVWCANTFAAAAPAMRPASVPPVSTSLLMSPMLGQHLAGALAKARARR
jgi:hypothetical protein